MERIGEHAVVIGASMAGLLAARVLSEAYDQVTIVERDELPPLGQGRRAVPQGRHAHALLHGGQEALEQLLPGFVRELVELGAPTMQPLLETRLTVAGHPLARVSVGPRVVLASRALFEGLVRQRVRALSRVAVLERCVALELLGTARRITGLRVRDRDGRDDEDVLDADLVVAATGRSRRVERWLESLGHAPAAEDTLAVDLTYVSRPLALRPGALGSDKLAAFSPRPGCPRGLTVLAQEDGRWLLTVSGYGDDRPPTEPDALRAFAAPVVPPDVLAAIGEAEPLGEVSTHGFAAHQRRRYKRLANFPDGLLVIGDAISSFNPVYGQGMSVAALEATELRRCLSEGTKRLAARYFRAAARIVDRAWELSVGSDLALPEVTASRSTRVRLSNAYARRVQLAAERDSAVSEAFVRVLGLLEPTTLLLRPDIALRVLCGGHVGSRPGRKVSPSGSR